MKSLFVQNSDIGVMPFGHAPINPTICVLGTPRSGTSMIAGLLRIMGVDMGNHVWSGNNEDLEFLIHNGRSTLQQKEN